MTTVRSLDWMFLTCLEEASADWTIRLIVSDTSVLGVQTHLLSQTVVGMPHGLLIKRITLITA